jgi:uncharacterized protein (TIGR01777 family)
LRFVISGASGLVGSALAASLSDDGHEVTRLVRRAPSPSGAAGDSAGNEVSWDPESGELDPDQLDGCQVFVNLSGAGIGDRRWSTARKQEIARSRMQPTALLADAVAKLAPPDGVLVSASAVGWYGDRGDEELTEQSTPGTGFLAALCRQWEAATAPAEQAGVRVVHLRSGVVIAKQGGALGRQLPLFRFGLGGRLGTGRQWMSWIAVEDEVGAIRHAASNASLRGPVNAVAPEPVTNAELTRQLAAAVHRPAFFNVPSPVLRVALGSGLATELLLASQRVLPARLLAAGYEFATPDLKTALAISTAKAK